jgi:hypothetical protein
MTWYHTVGLLLQGGAVGYLFGHMVLRATSTSVRLLGAALWLAFFIGTALRAIP